MSKETIVTISVEEDGLHYYDKNDLETAFISNDDWKNKKILPLNPNANDETWEEENNENN